MLKGVFSNIFRGLTLREEEKIEAILKRITKEDWKFKGEYFEVNKTHPNPTIQVFSQATPWRGLTALQLSVIQEMFDVVTFQPKELHIALEEKTFQTLSAFTAARGK